VPDYFAQGLRLFNEGRYFECHEAWEEVWKRATGDEKRFYQGLIQAAVAILHAERGNFDGARSLYEKAREKLEGFPSEYAGIALADLRAELARFFTGALDQQSVARSSRPLIHCV
jgi:predicted metal-dependent hydrolase